MGGFYHPGRRRACSETRETTKGPPSASPSVRIAQRAKLLAESLDLSLDCGAVLLERGEKLLRCFGVDRSTSGNVDLRREERRLRELREVALLGLLVLAYCRITDLERRNAEHELGCRSWRDAVGRGENHLRVLHVRAVDRIHSRGILVRLVPHHEQELRNGRLVLTRRHRLSQCRHRAVRLIQVDLRLRDAKVTMLRYGLELDRRLHSRQRQP